MTAETDIRAEPAYGYGADDISTTKPTQWPGVEQPAEKKKHRDAIDSLFTDISYPLLVSKSFYFFFFAAFGSLFPLIAVYFKQIGMNATQVGLLLGFRPFVEFASAPFWGTMVERFRRAKEVMLVSLFCWVVFTLALAFVQPTPNSCISHNTTHILLSPPWQDRPKRWAESDASLASGRTKRWAGVGPEIHLRTGSDVASLGRYVRAAPSETPSGSDVSDEVKYTTLDAILPHPKITQFGKSPLPLDHEDIANRQRSEVVGLVSPPFSSIVYKQTDINKAFLLILLLMVVGEFFSSPALVLADTATLGYLGDDLENYGRQRMLGSLGWAVAMFFVGIALDNSNMFRNHPCGHEQTVERNYTICFAVFSVLMSCAFIAATQFVFQQPGYADPKGGNYPMREVEHPDVKDATAAADEKVHISLRTPPDDAISDVTNSGVGERPSPFVPRGKPGQEGTIPEWMNVLKIFATVPYGAVIFVTWFMGFAVGLVFTFLFWHLQDLGGTPTLFGIASVINHISEIVAYFFSKKLIKSVGHVRVLYLGLVGNICRFLYISWLRDPWWVLPFEFVTGLTHAAVWAACCSYVTQAMPAKHRATAQLIIQGIHHGLGRGCGSIVGGILVCSYGTEYVFRGYGIACVAVLGAYLALDYFYLRQLGDTATVVEPHHILEETAHLAPCGVPMSLSRNLSSSRLDTMSDATPHAYGTTTTNGFLDPGNRGEHTVQDSARDPQRTYNSRDNYQEAPQVLPLKPPPSSGRRNRQQHHQQQYQDGPPHTVMMSAAPIPATEPVMQQPDYEYEDHSREWYQ
ncbi:hypothetical protein NP493_978g00021 [Ridgeia piscesae]|uniref:Major facilitator superfamily associated domain-containing protein n=1 Tax=Ridgeia piscesae TaxID=27915 RepID=A0AAD9NJF6_RIDPI|nr:hypothetical protein NP493_978g00021 [Ridgeia piscesae]